MLLKHGAPPIVILLKCIGGSKESTLPAFRYQTTGAWFKGNTHIHSTASDGGKTFTELANFYAGAGYHFLFRTDHWVLSNARADAQPYPLLWLDGVELDGYDRFGTEYHVVALGRVQDIRREMGLSIAMETARAQNALLVLAHPQWMGNSFEDAARWQFDGVEVYNHVCQWMNGKGHSGAYWNAMLKLFPNTLAFAADDAHARGKPGDPDLDRAWIVVNAAECTQETILEALRAGNFYSSTGPQIHTLQFDGERLVVECSPVSFARLVGPAYLGIHPGIYHGEQITRAEFQVPQNWPYTYLELEDAQGRLAWSNPLFVAE